MKLRPIQLVCLALLLATMRLADPAALAPDDFALRAGVLNVLLRGEMGERRNVATSRPLAVRSIPAPVERTSRPQGALPAAQDFRSTLPLDHAAACYPECRRAVLYQLPSRLAFPAPPL